VAIRGHGLFPQGRDVLEAGGVVVGDETSLPRWMMLFLAD